MKVLHGPVNIGNQPWVLSRAERALGLDSDLVVTVATWLDYNADRVLSPGLAPKGLAPKLRRVAFGVKAALGYDVLHYYFGQSYINTAAGDSRFDFADLKLARALGRRVFMTLQGCDVRHALASNRRNAVTMCKPDGCASYGMCLVTADRIRARLVADILPLCDRVFYLNPELGHHATSGTFMPYASCDIAAIAPVAPRHDRRPVIVHAPSDPTFKGTPLIEAALGKLQDRFAFDYRRVQGLAHADALQLYRDADLVIDQVLAGWYGGFAVEAMAMGKPVAAYIRDDDLGCITDAMRRELPILRLDPRTLADDLAALFERRAEWPELGRQSRAFVERWHDPARIAAAMKRCYEDPAAAFDLGLDA